MKQRLLSLIGIVMVLFLAQGNGWGQTISLTPNAIPNGIASLSGEQYHQRFDIQLGGTAVPASEAFTITLPAEVSYVTASATGAGNNSGLADIRVFSESASAAYPSSFNWSTTRRTRSIALFPTACAWHDSIKASCRLVSSSVTSSAPPIVLACASISRRSSRSAGRTSPCPGR